MTDRETPFAQAWGIFIMLTVGWMPGYLVFNATGPKKYRGKNANHFSPSAAFFKDDERALIVQTDIAFFMAVALLGYCISVFGALRCILSIWKNIDMLQKSPDGLILFFPLVCFQASQQWLRST